MKVKTAQAIYKLLNGSMKILRVDQKKAKVYIKKKTEGYPRVE